MFDLLAVGGTGQCLLLELCYRKRRHPATAFPTRIWIVDRDYANSLGAAVREELKALGAGHQWLRPTLDEGDDTGQNLNTLFGQTESGPPLVQQILKAAVTQKERLQPVREGFFAMPRVASAWVALVGFETAPGFLASEYLHTTEAQALCIVGSVAGGTGAGLMPSLVHRARADAPVQWKRLLRVIPVLPWFNPERSGRPNVPTWESCSWNAVDGVLELERLAGNLRSRIGNPADPTKIAATTIGLVGPTANARETAPPDLAEVQRARSFGGFVSLLADHVLDVVQQRRSTVVSNHPERVRLGLGALPAEMLDATSERSAGRRNRFVAEQVSALQAELAAKRDACSAPFGVVLSEGFGGVLGDIILARSLPKVSRQLGFWPAFDEQMASRIKSLGANAHTGRLPLASDVSATIRQIDSGWKAGHQQISSLLSDATHTDPDAKARDIANALVDRLLGERERSAVAWISEKAAPASFRPLITAPEQVGNPGHIEGDASLITFDGPLIRQLTASLRPPEILFHGASWARLLGQAHKFRSYHDIDASTDPDRALGRALVLWKGAVLGLAELSAHVVTDQDRTQAWVRAEDVDQDFGPEMTALSYGGQVLGFASADIGFVPAADLVDHWGDDAKREEAFRALHAEVRAAEKKLAESGQNLGHILEAFGRTVTTATRELAWYRLLVPAQSQLTPDQQQDVKSVLRAASFPGKRLFLRLKPGEKPAALRIPLVLRAEDKANLERIALTVGARSQFSTAGNEMMWRTTRVAFIEQDAGSTFLVRPVWSAIGNAAKATGQGSSANPLFSIDW